MVADSRWRQRVSRHGFVGIATLAVLLAACGSSTTGASSSSSSKPVNVGAIFPLTGVAGPYGTERFNGVEDAAKLINKAGGVLGRQLNVIPVNDGSDPVDAVADVRRMLATDNISVAEGLTAADWPDALPIFEQSKMVIFDEVPDPSLDFKVAPYEFRAVPSDGLEGAAMAVAAYTQHYTKVALAFQSTSDAQTLVPSLEHTAKTLGVSIVANPELPPSVPSYASEVATIVAAKPQAILMQLEPEPSGTFFESLRQELGSSTIPIIVSDVGATAAWIKSVGSASLQSDTISVTAATSSKGPGFSAYYNGYEALYGVPPAEDSANGYDGMTVAALAMDAAHSTNPSVYKNYVLKVTTPGAGITTCYTYATCLSLLKQGKRIKYSGVGSPMTYNKYHAITAGYEGVHVSTTGQLTNVFSISAETMAKYYK